MIPQGSTYSRIFPFHLHSTLTWFAWECTEFPWYLPRNVCYDGLDHGWVHPKVFLQVQKAIGAFLTLSSMFTLQFDVGFKRLEESVNLYSVSHARWNLGILGIFPENLPKSVISFAVKFYICNINPTYKVNGKSCLNIYFYCDFFMVIFKPDPVLIMISHHFNGQE